MCLFVYVYHVCIYLTICLSHVPAVCRCVYVYVCMGGGALFACENK